VAAMISVGVFGGGTDRPAWWRRGGGWRNIHSSCGLANNVGGCDCFVFLP